MTKPEMIAAFYDNHREFAGFIGALSDDEFVTSKNSKWTPGQQLDHVHLCMKPLAQALGSKTYIAEKFGRVSRPTLEYDTVIANYKAALAAGGKAPERFLPVPVEAERKTEIINALNEQTNSICQLLNTYSDEELDTLVLPHPFLGPLSVREMFYLMAYHAVHHQRQTEENLR